MRVRCARGGVEHTLLLNRPNSDPQRWQVEDALSGSQVGRTKPLSVLATWESMCKWRNLAVCTLPHLQPPKKSDQSLRFDGFGCGGDATRKILSFTWHYSRDMPKKPKKSKNQHHDPNQYKGIPNVVSMWVLTDRIWAWGRHKDQPDRSQQHLSRGFFRSIHM